MKTIGIRPLEIENHIFSMIYKKKYILLECENNIEAQKWVNSIKYVQKNFEEYEQDD